jgi:hypothetical protein
MAQKLQLLKLLQEIRGFADLGNRAPETRLLAQIAADLRSAHHPATLPVRRFSIPVTQEHHAETASHVPITPRAGLADEDRRVRRISLRPA